MKQIKKYIIVLIVFIVIMVLVLFFFINNYSNIHLKNKANELLKDLYTLKEGNYILKNGVILSEQGSVIQDKYYLSADGRINIDKYGNIKLLLDSDKKCISKTSLGDILIKNEKCSNFKKIDVNISKNNSKISFLLNENNLEYKISSKDDFKGLWNNDKYDTNLVLKYFKEGDNYIWFKDSEGNISDVIEFSVDCLYTNKAKYDSNVFYCSGSTIRLDKIEWIVLEDSNESIKLMKYLPLDEKLNHCYTEVSDYCYYTDELSNTYKWSNSYINYYLNNVFINQLSTSVKDRIKKEYVCDEFDNNTCNNELCGGYTKEEIDSNDWYCNNYVESYIKVISYSEFNKLYTKTKNRDIISGNYWAINSFRENKGSSVQHNNDFYVLEDFSNKLDVKPVITMYK